MVTVCVARVGNTGYVRPCADDDAHGVMLRSAARFRSAEASLRDDSRYDAGMDCRLGEFAGLIAIASLALTLSGCGGGGGSGANPAAGRPSPPPCVATVDPDCISQEEFERRRDAVAPARLADTEYIGDPNDPNLLGQPVLELINVHEAHAALAVKYGADVEPGAGVTVAVMDSGVDLDHGELDDADITETLLQNLPDEMRADYDADEFSHGTAVTSIMAAEDNDTGFLGIAWGATFKVFTMPIGDHLAEDDPLRDTFDWEAAYKSVLRSGADIVNASYGFRGTIIEDYTAEALRTVPRFGPPLQVVAQKGKRNPTIFVWLAGNSHGDECEQGDAHCVADSSSSTGYSFNAVSPELEGGAVAKLPELRGHNVVVVAVGADGSIADFSNRCGIAGPWCIAAPGTGITGAEFGSVTPSPGFFRVRLGLQGTSFAAPMVSGGLALMKHFFRSQLSNRELVTRLFATANKGGIYASDRTDGSSSVYGQGLMDLGAAVLPVGNVLVATSGLAGTGGHDIRNTQLRLGGAFGDGLARAVAGREIAAFDELGAPFWFALPALVGAPHRPSALARLQGLVAPAGDADRAAAHGTRITLAPRARSARRGGWRVGLHEPPVNAESSLLNLAGAAATMTLSTRDGLEATAFTTDHLPGRRTREMGALLVWRPPDGSFGVRAGWLGEDESALGSTADGAFGRLAADTFVTGFEAAAALGGWRLAADGEIGVVAAHADGGLIDGLSPLLASALSLRADRRLTERDGMTLSLSQPLRLENGSARFTLPVGRTGDGRVVREAVSAPLAPSARQLDLAARWRRTGLFGGALQVEAAASHNPGHTAAAPVLSLLAGWRAEF